MSTERALFIEENLYGTGFLNNDHHILQDGEHTVQNAASVVVALIAWAGGTGQASSAVAEQDGELRFVVIEGEDAVNRVQREAHGERIRLDHQFTDDFQAAAGTVRQRFAQTFSGALDGSVVNGTVAISLDQTLLAPAGPGIACTGGYPTASGPVTLTRQ